MRGHFGIGRVLIVLALIVQIFAPVASSASMVRAAFDPLAEATLCVHDAESAAGDDGSAPHLDRHRLVCDFCQLASAGGYAPPPPPIQPASPVAAAVASDWRLTVEAVVGPRLLDQIRGRAPPISA